MRINILITNAINLLVVETAMSYQIWEKNPLNPILSGSTSETYFDFMGIGGFSVLYLPEVDPVYPFKLWYTGYGLEPVPSPPYFSYRQRIGFVKSSDGINWIKVQGPGEYGEVIKLGDPDDEDDVHVTYPIVFYNENKGGYTMLYTGDRGLYGQLFTAFSYDGIHWGKYQFNPIFDFGNLPTPFSKWFVTPNWRCMTSASSLVKINDNSYLLFINGRQDLSSSINPTSYIGRISSNNLIGWNFSQDLVVLSPEFFTDAFDNIGLGFLGGVDVILKDNKYYLYYTGLSIENFYCTEIKENFRGERIGYATSSDGIHWNKCYTPPELNITKYGSTLDKGNIGDFDSYSVKWPRVIKIDINGDVSYRMYYIGEMKIDEDEIITQLGYAELIFENDECYYYIKIPLNSFISLFVLISIYTLTLMKIYKGSVNEYK